jgi:4-hydroxybenzoate polyprenyltransferase
MRSGIVQFIFFANYFVGLLAVALSVETVFQLGLPLASPVYYILLFSATVMYYTYAYSGAAAYAMSSNPRTEWYRLHHSFIRQSQKFFVIICLASSAFLFYQYSYSILQLPLYYWLLLVSIPLAGLLYYGLLPSSFNLRNTGWFKAFVIGFVWAGCVNFLPVTMAKIEYGIHVSEPGFMLWLFLKNWMFCTVNAIMFDIKDYEDDANRQLKTFVVRFGLQKTIFFVLIPLLFIGIVSLLIFTHYKNFSALVIGVNLLPFLSLLYVAYSLQRPKKILYYLIVIDGLLLVKALCGISGIVLLRLFP